jgi:ABC-type amino acid transport system permease subunit
VHWGGIVFAAVVIVPAIPFAVSHAKGANSSVRLGASKGLLATVIVAALLLISTSIVGALDGFPNRAAYWILNIALAAVFWITLLRLSWTERRQRPR